ncbi:hypothetical protein BU26DRAFT_161486 [Trematosphaeria pertusa]|uniref:Uncharacterized protein n=1 Tax=Trematosphaeria pertusa TaxID=390896 RepID=A0A6A6HWK5_9PLEO|nr:uncharacterized protein BU26DRAFT_161486 [Trematosphaeria pertusa]KAF2242466.1 hypothetical protein BU26DRAFT_161486 [Trematosphaeria pertusa]
MAQLLALSKSPHVSCSQMSLLSLLGFWSWRRISFIAFPFLRSFSQVTSSFAIPTLALLYWMSIFTPLLTTITSFIYLVAKHSAPITITNQSLPNALIIRICNAVLDVPSSYSTPSRDPPNSAQPRDPQNSSIG